MEQVYEVSRSVLIELLREAYLDGYSCGWRRGYGPEQFLDDWLRLKKEKAAP